MTIDIKLSIYEKCICKFARLYHVFARLYHVFVMCTDIKFVNKVKTSENFLSIPAD